jgi:hypothetical protein
MFRSRSAHHLPFLTISLIFRAEVDRASLANGIDKEEDEVGKKINIPKEFSVRREEEVEALFHDSTGYHPLSYLRSDKITAPVVLGFVFVPVFFLESD